MYKFKVFIIFCLTFLVTACSDPSFQMEEEEDNGTVTVNSLNSLPDFSELLDNSGLSSSQTRGVRAVEGTPPKFSDISENDLGDYFFGDLLDTSFQNLSSDQRSNFFDEFFNGMSKCQMMDASSRALSGLERMTVSLCYMREMSEEKAAGEAEPALTLTPSSELRTELFKKGSQDKLVKVSVSSPNNEEEEGEVFIKVMADSSYQYEAYLFQCSEGSPVFYNHIAVGNDSIAFTANGAEERMGGVIDVALSAMLKNEGGRIKIDASRGRNMSVHNSINGTFSFGDETVTIDDVFKSKMAIAASEMELMMMMKNNQENGYFLNKVYSTTDYIGTGFSDVRFSAGALSNSMANYDNQGEIYWQPVNSSCEPLYPVTGTEYRSSSSPFYANETSSANYQLASNAPGYFSGETASGVMPSSLDSSVSFDYNADNLGAPENNVAATAAQAGFSCNDTPDVTVVFDGSIAANQAIFTACEPRVEHRNICNAAWSRVAQMGQAFGGEGGGCGGGESSGCADEASCQALFGGDACSPAVGTPGPGDSWSYDDLTGGNITLEQIICISQYVDSNDSPSGCLTYEAFSRSLADGDPCDMSHNNQEDDSLEISDVFCPNSVLGESTSIRNGGGNTQCRANGPFTISHATNITINTNTLRLDPNNTPNIVLTKNGGGAQTISYGVQDNYVLITPNPALTTGSYTLSLKGSTEVGDVNAISNTTNPPKKLMNTVNFIFIVP